MLTGIVAIHGAKNESLPRRASRNNVSASSNASGCDSNSRPMTSLLHHILATGAHSSSCSVSRICRGLVFVQSRSYRVNHQMTLIPFLELLNHCYDSEFLEAAAHAVKTSCRLRVLCMRVFHGFCRTGLPVCPDRQELDGILRSTSAATSSTRVLRLSRADEQHAALLALRCVHFLCRVHIWFCSSGFTEPGNSNDCVRFSVSVSNRLEVEIHVSQAHNATEGPFHACRRSNFTLPLDPLLDVFQTEDPRFVAQSVASLALDRLLQMPTTIVQDYLILQLKANSIANLRNAILFRVQVKQLLQDLHQLYMQGEGNLDEFADHETITSLVVLTLPAPGGTQQVDVGESEVDVGNETDGNDELCEL